VLQENDDVKEALRRLPAHKVDERSFRIMRAMQLSLQKIELPKEQWTKFEEVIFKYINNCSYYTNIYSNFYCTRMTVI